MIPSYHLPARIRLLERQAAALGLGLYQLLGATSVPLSPAEREELDHAFRQIAAAIEAIKASLPSPRTNGPAARPPR